MPLIKGTRVTLGPITRTPIHTTQDGEIIQISPGETKMIKHLVIHKIKELEIETTTTKVTGTVIIMVTNPLLTNPDPISRKWWKILWHYRNKILMR